MKTHTLPFTSRRLTHLAFIGLTLGCIPLVQASDVSLSGFLSVGGGFIDDDKSIPYGEYTKEDLTFKNNLFGLQATGKVSDKLTATAQLIARSTDEYSVTAEWAYLSYQLTDSSKILAGRLRLPFFMYSDVIDVGYAYSWVAPPREVYNSVPLNSVDGVEYYTTQTLGPLDATLQAYFGSYHGTPVFSGKETETDLTKAMGVAATLGKDWWTLRAAYHQASASIDLNSTPLGPNLTIGSFADTLTALGYAKNAKALEVEDDKGTFAEVGLNIDTGKFIATLERIEIKVKDTPLPNSIRQFAMIGVRQGDWLFNLTASQSKDKTLHPETGIPANVTLPVVGSSNVLIATLQAIASGQVQDRKVISVGTRWDFTSSAALKFQIDDVDDSIGDQKLFSVALQTVF